MRVADKAPAGTSALMVMQMRLSSLSYFFAAQGLQGDFAFLAAHGLQGPAGFFATHGLQTGFLAPQG